MHRVGYARIIGLLHVTAAALAVVAFGLSGVGLYKLFFAASFGALGYRYLTAPALLINGAGEIELKGLLGGSLKRIPIRSIGDLEFDGETVYVRSPDGSRSKVIGGFLLDRGDVARLREAAMPTARLVSSTDG
jgi:hypothetical protein